MARNRLTRRTALAGMAAAGATLVSGCSRGEAGQKTPMTTTNTNRMPALFLAHGSPFLLDDQEWVNQLEGWAKALPRPKSILMISAHWEEQPLTLGATKTVPLVYDFYGFPEKYYQVKYPAPGAPELAERVAKLFGAKQPVARNPTRGLDHGAYVPLVAMYPNADVPVLQISIPSEDPRTLFELGKTLAPLREEGVLIAGSGFITHNLRAFRMYQPGQKVQWATDFDSWTADVVRRKDVDALLDYKAKAPGVRESLPTHEHFVPLITAMGAASDSQSATSFPIEGFMLGAFTKRSVQFG